MRLRFGVVLCLLAMVWGVGCRKPLTPNVDRNLAPETWITAAPMDTITLRDANGKVIPPPDPTVHVIPVRFHMYWAGSDPDGAVVGYYYAVTETTAVPEPGTSRLPELPGPKPRDYHYTTHTDTAFIFNVTEGSPDRQHAFYLFAVDDRGKADPTPARFMFTAIDKYPACPVFERDSTYAAGTIYVVEGGVLTPKRDFKLLTDPSIPRTLARDSAAVNASLHFQWTVRLGIAGSFVRKYCWRLEESDFGCNEDPSLRSVTYAGPFSAGTKVFTLRVVDEAQGVCDSTRRFVLNYMPDTWFAGPDPQDPHFVQTPDVNGDRHYVDLSGVDQMSWPGIPSNLTGPRPFFSGLSPDSFKVLPLDRPQRKTFWEYWNNRIYAHFENDTVHMNSWVVFYNGGYDKDSKYVPRVDPADPALPPDFAGNPGLYPLLEAQGHIGSPIGFRSRLSLKLPDGSRVDFAQSGLYPIFDPASVFRLPQVAGYWRASFAGKFYAVARAQDSDGLLDPLLGSAIEIADRVDAGGGTPEERLYRRKILTFHVRPAARPQL